MMDIGAYVRRMKEEATSKSFWRDVLAETLATFFLVSVQCALPLSWDKGNVGGSVQTALGMGFVVIAIGWSLGDFGGAHMNPAVTFSMAICCKITALRAVIYVAVQCIGGIAGAGFVYGMTPSAHREGLAATTLHPEVKPWQGMLIEAWITAILVTSIHGATNQQRKGALFIPTIPIGFAVALGIMSAFASTGGSMNPARSLGPAVAMGIWDDHWVYWIGPFLGGGVATILYAGLLNHILSKSEDHPALSSVAVAPMQNNETTR